MFHRLAAALCLACAVAAPRESTVYEGTWSTTNRRLDGTMSCIVTPLPHQQWEGRFVGVWQGAEFDYTVPFDGPPSDLRGTATIDGASYEWRGSIHKNRFAAHFTGDRYIGSFELTRKR